MKACKKPIFPKQNTQPVSKFFTVSGNTPAPVLRVVEALKKQNEMGGFMPSLVKNEGYALWDKSLIELSPSTTVYNREGESVDTLIFTPIVQQDSNFVNGFFFSRIVRDSVELHLYRANDYDLYPYGSADSTVVTAEFITLKILELNETIFGHRKYELKDSLLFGTTNNSRLNLIRTTLEIDTTILVHGKWAITSLCIETISCYCLQEGNNCDLDHRCMNGNCDRCYWCTDVNCTTIAIPGAGGTGASNWPPDPPLIIPGEGSGGGGGTPPDNGDCTGVGNCRPSSLIAEGRVPCGGCGPGPMVVVPLDDDIMDSNGFYSSRIAQLDSLLSHDEFALLPCDSLTLISMQSYGIMYQDVANAQMPYVLLNRLDSINNIFTNSSINSPIPIFQQTLSNANGTVVNCDFFPIKITQLPTGFTAESLLEYFRIHIDSFAHPEATFSPYWFSAPGFGPSIYDTAKFYSPMELSTGALIHIGILGNDGTVMQTQYMHHYPPTYSNESHSFMFTTLHSPLDYAHPVAGNRRFGIYKTNASNDYTFYTMGVDRVWSWAQSLLFSNIILNGGDVLWSKMQENMISFIVSNGGQAHYYNKTNYTARPKWDSIKKYLKKEITLEQLKSLLGC